MPWTDLPLAVTGAVIPSTWGNQVRDNFAMLKLHAHTGANGDGGTSLGPLVRADFTDGAAPVVPGAGITRLYSVAGRMRTRAGTGGADSQLVSSLDGVAQGDILYLNASLQWVRRAAGTNGQFLKTQGPGADPVWANVTGINVLAESLAGGDVSTFTFTSIPSTYRTLWIVGHVRATSAQLTSAIGLRLNNNSSSGYTWTKQEATGTTMTVTTPAATTRMEVGVYEETAWTNFYIYISGYAQAEIATILAQSAARQPSGGYFLNTYVGSLNVAAQVSQVDILATQNAFGSGSFVTIYGVPSL